MMEMARPMCNPIWEKASSVGPYRESKGKFYVREGAHGEWCVDWGFYEVVRESTVGRAATKEDAEKIAETLNLMRR